MLLRCLPSSFGSIWPTVWEEMSFEEFQDGHHCSHLGYRDGTILAILNLYNAPMPPIKFQLNLIYGLGGDVVWIISTWPRGGHLGHRNGRILIILNLCVTVMLPIMFWLNPTYGLGGDVVWRISRWPPSWTSERNDFLQFWISMSPRCLQSSFGSVWLTVWEEMSFEELQDGRHDGHLGYRNGTILAILNLYIALMLLIKFRLNLTYGLGGDVVWRCRILNIGTERFLAILNLCATVMPPIKFQLNWTYGLGGDAAILDIGKEWF